jgi:hypothetical protein
MRPPSLPGLANQNLKWDVFARIFGKQGRALFSDMLPGTPKITLTRDTRTRCISHHSFVCLFQITRP